MDRLLKSSVAYNFGTKKNKQSKSKSAKEWKAYAGSLFPKIQDRLSKTKSIICGELRLSWKNAVSLWKVIFTQISESFARNCFGCGGNSQKDFLQDLQATVLCIWLLPLEWKCCYSFWIFHRAFGALMKRQLAITLTIFCYCFTALFQCSKRQFFGQQ